MKLRLGAWDMRWTGMLLLALTSAIHAAAPEYPKQIILSQAVPSRPCAGAGCIYDPTMYSTGYEVGTSAEQRLGEVLATGDFDKDGLPDLVLGMPSYSGGLGRIDIVFGNLSSWQDALSNLGNTTVSIASKSSEYRGLGSAFAVGDLTGDGLDDLAMSAPDGPAPTVFILPGSSQRWSTLSIDVASSSLILILKDKSNAGNLGKSLAIGDMLSLSSSTTDGKLDLLMGMPSAETAILTAGPISASMDVSTDTRSLRFISSRAEALGSTVQFVPDLDKGGVPEFALGAPNSNSGSGRVYLVEARALSTFQAYGDSNIIDISQASFSRRRVFSLSAKYNGNNVGRFGTAILSGIDINRDGFNDLLISAPDAPLESSNLPKAGRIYILMGNSSTSSTGVYGSNTTTVNTTTFPSFQGSGTDEHLGGRLSLALDNGTDYPMFLATTGLDVNGSSPLKGGMWLLSGRTKSAVLNLMPPDGTQFLSELSQEELGMALLSGPRFDLDRDSFSEMVFGAPGYDSGLVGEVGRLFFLRTADYIDNDLDGQTEAEGDCDDVNPKVAYQSLAEVCDGLDNDCDGYVDMKDSSVVDPIYRYADRDRDGFGDPATSFYGCASDAPRDYVSNSSDCNDLVSEISPAAQEICDQLDNDCDGAIDLADSSVKSVSVWPDKDGDGAGDALSPAKQVCPNSPQEGYSTNALDCDDTRQEVGPNAPESCDDLDNDCDGLIDDEDEDTYTNANGGQLTLYVDQDGDGYGDADESSESLYRCEPRPGYSTVGSDCNDQMSSIYPNAPEGTIYSSTLSCYFPDGQDNDCDQQIDESTCDTDDDQDGQSELEGDCNDSDATIFEGAVELCDELDQDCDGDPSNGFDLDNDGFDDANLCPAGVDLDCNDEDANVYPGAPEQCNGLDDDCSAQGEESDEPSNEETLEADADEDGVRLCAGDCQDNDASVYPGAPELCDQKDNNCNAQVDEQLDTDQDGSSQCYDCDDTDPDRSPELVEQCDGKDNNCDGELPSEELDADLDGVSSCAGDCDDADASRSPLGDESLQCNGIDDDCSGSADDMAYFDGDEDGYLSAEACAGQPGALDCNDQAADIYPGATELPGDGVDSDCDGEDLPSETLPPISPLPEVLVVDGLGCSCTQSSSAGATSFGSVWLLGMALLPILRRRVKVRQLFPRFSCGTDLPF